MNTNTMRNLIIGCLMPLATSSWAANAYVQKNLVSDVPGLADQTDPALKNPWAIAASPTSPFWISNNHSGTAGVYNSSGQPQALVVAIPAAADGAKGSPTGQVFNDTGGFVLTGGKPASFLFTTEDGLIAGWNGDAGTTARITVNNSAAGAVYKGLAIGVSSSGPRLYATDFARGIVDVYDTNFAPVTTPGGFTDANLPPGFAPFGIQRIGRKLYVTYALQGDEKEDDVPGAGNGFINVFDLDGNMLARLVSQGPLNSPWGIALAPANFGDFSQALLVGNFGDGTINAFDPCSGELLGALKDPMGNPIQITGLWGLMFGNGKAGGDPFTLYFAAGIAGDGAVEDHGLFGSLTVGTPAVAPPPPASIAARIANFSFTPNPIESTGATKIEWTNNDAAAHTITSDTDGLFDSGEIGSKGVFSTQLTAPGTYQYHCRIHPFMKGSIVVK